MPEEFHTTHDLAFEAAEWENGLVLGDLFGEEPFSHYRVGTMMGAWRCTDTAFEILSFYNLLPGNGHLIDTIEWFEHSAKRGIRALRILAVGNKRFKEHLMRKWGFVEEGEDNLIKSYTDERAGSMAEDRPKQ